VQTISCLLFLQEATEDKKEKLALAKHSGNLVKASFMDINFRPIDGAEIDVKRRKLVLTNANLSPR